MHLAHALSTYIFKSTGINNLKKLKKAPPLVAVNFHTSMLMYFIILKAKDIFLIVSFWHFLFRFYIVKPSCINTTVNIAAKKVRFCSANWQLSPLTSAHIDALSPKHSLYLYAGIMLFGGLAPTNHIINVDLGPTHPSEYIVQ